MTYVTYSRGFKSGGFDMRGNAAVYPQTQNGYNSETADNYEAGPQVDLLDDTLLLNLTVFYDPYKNAQIGVQQFVDTPARPPNSPRCSMPASRSIRAPRSSRRGGRRTALTLGAQHRLPRLVLRGLPDRLQRVHAAPGCATERPQQSISRTRIGPLNAPAWTVSGNASTPGTAAGHVARARRLRLAQLHQGRQHHAQRDRSAGIRAHQCRACVHDHEQRLAFLVRRQEPRPTSTTVSRATISATRRSAPANSSSAASARSASMDRRAPNRCTAQYHF